MAIQRWGAPLLASAVLLGLTMVAACGPGGLESDRPDQLQVKGLVIEVIPRNMTEIETLRIRDDQGTVYTFATEGFVGFTPSHLREHQLFGQVVVVTYVQEDGRLIALKVAD